MFRKIQIFLNYYPIIKMEIKHKIQFGGNTDKLAKQVLSGEKIATSSLYDYYRMNLKEMSQVNDYASILDSHGNKICIVRIERIEIVQFQNITETFAIEEGDGNLQNWLKIHTEYYSEQLEKIGRKLMNDTELVCEWFKVILSPLNTTQK